MLRLSLRLAHVSSRRYLPSRFYATANAALLATDNNNIYASSSSSSSSGPDDPHNIPPRREDGSEYVSDQEWEVRTGRAMDVLQQTLPSFFSTGLVGTNYHLPLHIHRLLGSSQKGKGKGKGKGKERANGNAYEEECETCAEGEEGGIYERTVRLEYTPPVALPAPLPRMLKVDGLPLYVASSVFLRHGMHALYTDLAVAIHKVQIHSGRPGQPPSPSLPASSSSPPSPPAPPNSPNSIDADSSREKQRECAITIGLLVSGVGRLGLSNERAEWDVNTTYTFSPHTGRIILHTVNAIHPAPSETVYAAFQGALSTLSSGFGGGGKGAGAMNVVQGKHPR